MEKIRVAVVGVGSLGQHHARNFYNNSNCNLIGVVDVDNDRSQKIAKSYGATAFTDYREIIGKVDAASVAVPTVEHFRIARELLNNKIHVLVEKPITSTVKEAHELIDHSRLNQTILQVGHIERFNAPIMKMRELVTKPAFIEAHRLGPFAARVKDIGVVMDLMIHDLDIILEIVQSEVISIDAVGVSVFTEFEDIANARLHFKNGCIANITASRVTPKKQRKIRIFQEDTYLTIDSDRPSVEVFNKVPVQNPKPGELPVEIVRKKLRFKREEPLKVEIDHFINCIRNGQQPQITGEKARDALQLAVEITERISGNGRPG